jgi:hypothetical protein
VREWARQGLAIPVWACVGGGVAGARGYFWAEPGNKLAPGAGEPAGAQGRRAGVQVGAEGTCEKVEHKAGGQRSASGLRSELSLRKGFYCMCVS